MTGDGLGVADRLDLLDLVGRYAHAVDQRDVDAVTELFAIDARLEFVSTGSVHVGRDAIAEFFRGAFTRPALAAATASTHLMTNTVIEQGADGATAHLETSAVAYLATADPGGVIARGLTYTDRCTRTAAGWRLAERIHRLRWQATMPGGPVSADPL